MSNYTKMTVHKKTKALIKRIAKRDHRTMAQQLDYWAHKDGKTVGTTEVTTGEIKPDGPLDRSQVNKNEAK